MKQQCVGVGKSSQASLSLACCEQALLGQIRNRWRVPFPSDQSRKSTPKILILRAQSRHPVLLVLWRVQSPRDQGAAAVADHIESGTDQQLI
jgi:hypothetical protein